MCDILAALPDTYGLSDMDKDRMLELILATNHLFDDFGAVPEGDPSLEDVYTRLDEIEIDPHPLIAPLEFSDQACDPPQS